MQDNTPKTETEAYALMDRLDDAQLIAEMQGRIISDIAQKMCYDFPIGKGERVTGLTKRGINECVRWIADNQGIAINEKSIRWEPDQIDPEYVLFVAKAERVNNGVSTFVTGQKRQWIKMERGIYEKQNGRRVKVGSEIIDDPFWFEKGSAKAMRNAKINLIPIDVYESFLSKAIEEKKKADYNKRNCGNGRYQQQRQQYQQRPVHTPPPPKPRPKTQVEQIRDFWKQSRCYQNIIARNIAVFGNIEDMPEKQKALLLQELSAYKLDMRYEIRDEIKDDDYVTTSFPSEYWGMTVRQLATDESTKAGKFNSGRHCLHFMAHSSKQSEDFREYCRVIIEEKYPSKKQKKTTEKIDEKDSDSEPEKPDWREKYLESEDVPDIADNKRFEYYVNANWLPPQLKKNNARYSWINLAKSHINVFGENGEHSEISGLQWIGDTVVKSQNDVVSEFGKALLAEFKK